MNIHDVHGHIVVTSNMHKQSLPHTKTHIHMHIHTYTHKHKQTHFTQNCKNKNPTPATETLSPTITPTETKCCMAAKAQKLNIFFSPRCPQKQWKPWKLLWSKEAKAMALRQKEPRPRRHPWQVSLWRPLWQKEESQWRPLWQKEAMEQAAASTERKERWRREFWKSPRWQNWDKWLWPRNAKGLQSRLKQQKKLQATSRRCSASRSTAECGPSTMSLWKASQPRRGRSLTSWEMGEKGQQAALFMTTSSVPKFMQVQESLQQSHTLNEKEYVLNEILVILDLLKMILYFPMGKSHGESDIFLGLP